MAYAVSQFVNGISSPLVGYLVDRLGPRRLVFIGGTILCVGLFASGHVTELWHIVLLYGCLMTLGANCLGLVVFVPMLSRHFVRNRGMAVSIVQSANGFARAFSAPLTTVMIAGLGDPDFQWKKTLVLAIGLVIFCAFVFVGGLKLPIPLCPDVEAIQSAIKICRI